MQPVLHSCFNSRYSTQAGTKKKSQTCWILIPVIFVSRIKWEDIS